MIDPDKTMHIYPNNDLGKHWLECVYPPIGNPYCPCRCIPQHKEENGCLIVIHNSFDGREGVEWTAEILNNQ